MDTKEGDDEESLSRKRETLVKFQFELQQRIEEATSVLQASGSGSSDSTLTDLQKLSTELQQLLNTTAIKAQDPSKEVLHIHDELDKVFFDEEVGHSCDLCHRDLARDPERPNASLRSLQEACVLSCGHVYHFKCLKGTTLDIDNHSKDPSCIFCVSFSS